MTQTDAGGTARAGAGVWIFRILLVAGAAFMAYTWFQPWWSADVTVIKGTDDLVLHPWGIETVAQVRANADESMWAMPAFFFPFAWAYFGVAMLALAASLFVNRTISVFRFKLPVAAVLIFLVGLSYLVAVGLAYGIGELRAASIGTNFIGKSTFIEPQSDAKIKMVSDLRIGYWLSLYASLALIVLSLLRRFFVGKAKA